MGDFLLSQAYENSLFLSKNKLSKSQYFIEKDNIEHHTPFNIFFEGLRTNNEFVNSIDKILLIELFKLAKNKNIDLCFVKIKHSNKNHCLAGGKWYFNFFKTFLQKSTEVNVEFSVLKANNVQVLDSISLKHKNLYINSGDFFGLDIDSNRYKEFLDYYSNNKVKSG